MWLYDTLFFLVGFQTTVLSTGDTLSQQQTQTATVTPTVLERMIANSSPTKKVTSSSPQFRTPSPVQASGISLAGRHPYAQRIGVSATAGGILPLSQANVVSGTASVPNVPTPFATGQTVLLNTTVAGATQLPMSLGGYSIVKVIHKLHILL